MSTLIRASEPQDEGGVGCVLAMAASCLVAGLTLAGLYYAAWWLAGRPAVFFERLTALVVLVLALVGLVIALVHVELALNRRRPGASLRAPLAEDSRAGCPTASPLSAGERRLLARGRAR